MPSVEEHHRGDHQPGDSACRNAHPKFKIFPRPVIFVEATEMFDNLPPSEPSSEMHGAARRSVRKARGRLRPNLACLRNRSVPEVALNHFDTGRVTKPSEQCGKRSHGPKVGRIQKSNETPSRLRNAAIAGRRRPPVGLPYEYGIWACSTDNPFGGELRSVIDDNDLQILDSLGEHACKRVGEELAGVERRDHDADKRRSRHFGARLGEQAPTFEKTRDDLMTGVWAILARYQPRESGRE
jgi:hypothetical protein